MHSHDRTMLAKLGFADPDKKDALHDAACRYMATSESYQKLVDRFVKLKDGFSHSGLTKYSIDFHIGKGSGQYRTTVGFADVVLIGKLQEQWWDNEKKRISLIDHTFSILIEVKIGWVSAGDIIRQLGLYRSYRTADLVVCACAFQMNAAEVQSLKNEGIRYVYLGESFREYAAKERSEVAECMDF